MAKAIMIFEDNDDGGVTMKAEFEPPLEDGQALTKAQQMVLAMAGEAGEMIKNNMD